MVRFIAALDEKRGIANDHGIPWQGKVPADVAYYRDKIKTGRLLMGYGVYKELTRPYENEYHLNYVAIQGVDEPLRDGFEPVQDARQFIQAQTDDVWNAGGAMLFKSTFDLADELYITQLEGDFQCTKFFPEFEEDFTCVSRGEPITENGITFHFEVWKRNEQ